MSRLPALALSGVALMILSGCGGGGGNDGFAFPPAADTGRGSVVTQPPERVQRLTADQFTTVLQATAVVAGDIHTPRIAIVEGAKVSGEVKMDVSGVAAGEGIPTRVEKPA